MKTIETVADLKKFLEENDLSPEAFAKVTNVSHMTWRRLLALSPNALIKDKYKAIISHSFSLIPISVPELFHEGVSSLDPEEIVKTGMNRNVLGVEQTLAQDGERVRSLSVVVSQAKVKLGQLVEHSKISFLVKELFRHLRAPRSHLHKTMIVGALLYFVNPFDLIADAIAPLGLIDDLGVISIVLKKIHREINTQK